jgi:hypothetical protein
VGLPVAGEVVGTGVGVSVPPAPVAGDAVGTGVGELVADGPLESAAPEPEVLADWLAGPEWPTWLAWLAAAAAEQPANATPPTAPSTQPAMTRDRLSCDCTCVLHDLVCAVDVEHREVRPRPAKVVRPGQQPLRRFGRISTSGTTGGE